MEKNPDKILMFSSFIECGLVLPASDFFHRLLDYYKIEYIHQNTNSIFHVLVFVHFCEAFLGIRRHWTLLRKFFRVKLYLSREHPGGTSQWSGYPGVQRDWGAVLGVQAH
jgi:hypothetical protein